ncbi:biotin--[acetyl-CoA-carboxylase] ligase [Nitrosophilus kaiyonis]|uniref:biotin--[acetyl-CoA-carboxylase] ligase n=1 Tax=Nitrosophilus kaiyonis TaxID=2930200 RepID=UPI0024939969|nr:biotin--[acetyl-CoA-carboxylase] ligase [Nitrosophilus kaiyonis]
MEIIYLDEVNSTQLYLIEKIKSKELLPSVAVVAKNQKNGIGSRGNRWIGRSGNLFFSFAIYLNDLPNDLKIQSSSIYFSYILKSILEEEGSSIWLKWPNDFYIENLKIGGTISNLIGNIIICGIGLNIKENPENFGKLDIEIDKNEILEKYFEKIEKKISWKEIFSKYKLEFHKSKKYFVHSKNEKISLENAKLCEDGSIEINSKRIYSLR